MNLLSGVVVACFVLAVLVGSAGVPLALDAPGEPTEVMP
jgi:hypothetical protein